MIVSFPTGKYLGAGAADLKPTPAAAASEYSVAKKRPQPDNFDANVRAADEKSNLKARKPKIAETESRY